MKTKVKRREPIDKRFPFAIRLQVWTPTGHVMLEGPSTEEGCKAVFTAAMANTGDAAKKKASKRNG